MSNTANAPTEQTTQPVDVHAIKSNQKSLTDIFNKNTLEAIIPEVKDSTETKATKPEKVEKVAKPTDKLSHDDANQADSQPTTDTKDNAPVAETKASKENTTAQAEQQEFDRRLKESRQRFDDLSRKLRGVEKIVKDYATQGALTTEEAQKILEQAEHQALEHPPAMAQTPWHLYAQVWDQELDNMRKYSGDPNIDQYVYAFQHFMANATQHELNQALQAFDQCNTDSIALTRKMLELGKTYHADIYGEYAEAGGLKNYKLKYEDKLAEQQKIMLSTFKTVHF